MNFSSKILTNFICCNGNYLLYKKPSGLKGLCFTDIFQKKDLVLFVSCEKSFDSLF